ncbi:MAG TPA: 30S ribosomal protein S6e [Methanoregulaceae archaeon]|nr:MAG: 30S ribosomal protein S6e [Methanolinea sp.]HON82031.1 30S ribosomal protein S6e [Methanoregulaceae archaeon]HPD10955.1 30S ribosomal protein S6e [Methanoregulaceae archaeon]HRT15915.1 30S ribosomal protein S6e [Methanoregulaceae archaeon]HRU31380.1 30S ribosomal protein S6e [Methanoregulaceae archaeon]
MVEFKVVVSDQKTGRSYNVNVSGGQAGAIIGKRIGDELDAGPLGLPGYRMEITGGSDRDGTPARRNLPIAGRKRLLLSGGAGFRPVREGQRRRKSIRGNEITADFVQINARITAYGEKPLEEYFAKPAPEENKE